jgi:NADPH-dependent ferric siderophore reductase
VGTERHSARAARQWLYEVAGLAKGQVRATAYWQRGVSGAAEKLEE